MGADPGASLSSRKPEDKQARGSTHLVFQRLRSPIRPAPAGLFCARVGGAFEGTLNIEHRTLSFEGGVVLN